MIMRMRNSNAVVEILALFDHGKTDLRAMVFSTDSRNALAMQPLPTLGSHRLKEVHLYTMNTSLKEAEDATHLPPNEKRFAKPRCPDALLRAIQVPYAGEWSNFVGDQQDVSIRSASLKEAGDATHVPLKDKRFAKPRCPDALLRAIQLTYAGDLPSFRIGNGPLWNPIPAAAAAFSTEAKMRSASVPRYKFPLKNPRWSKFPEPSATASLMLIWSWVVPPIEETSPSSRNASQNRERTPVHRARRRTRGLAPEFVPPYTTTTSTGVEGANVTTSAAAAAAATAASPAYYTLQELQMSSLFRGGFFEDVEDWLVDFEHVADFDEWDEVAKL
ncbi:hypothetical protein HPB51_012390 [Rhipicephalus microplus]|uniref:Uncharacterized protein n=1 Tax=Rhipicephalus microplus TaxID=6941 RepID=A0A9J6E9B3_RHIMP|nr:hypothetical protein HPB51_012390 [Rhipicephalus microplus]